MKMFKRRLLYELQAVQARIRECKTRIKELDPPEPKTYKIGYHTRKWIDALTCKLHPSVDDLLCKTVSCVEELDVTDVYDYLHQIGEFFINIADYNNKQEKYQRELKLLLQEEIKLKERLGIE
jgi:hypothetical protein